MKFDFRSESFKRKFRSNLFACNLILDVQKRIVKIFPKRLLSKEIKKPELKFNPELGLSDL